MGVSVTLAAQGPALPFLLVAPPCALLMLILAGYVLAMREADMPESRRRIRTAGSIVMMMTLPLIVYLFSIVSASTPRRFILTWAVLIGLIFMLVVLALVDVFNNVRLHAKMRGELRTELADLQRDVHRAVKEQAAENNSQPKLRLTENETGNEPPSDAPGSSEDAE